MASCHRYSVIGTPYIRQVLSDWINDSKWIAETPLTTPSDERNQIQSDDLRTLYLT